MNVRLVSAVQADLSDALDWYRSRGADLDQRFLAAFNDALEAIQDHPEIGSPVDDDLRRHLLTGFPYGVFYMIRGGEIIVMGCLHGARDPKIWRGRGAG